MDTQRQNRINEGKAVLISGAFITVMVAGTTLAMYGFLAVVLIIVAALGVLMTCVGLETVATETENIKREG